ncbi:MAG: 3-deoxy-manno-octulosonate cytidylyltransferase [Magnetovibrio sp.]|nr:3-deoxy-manno-octulosonate cytidylyltransferase [Magnetovibrio sp.]
MLKLPCKPIVIIPARMASTRLPGKPLADINGLAMIVQVLNRAVEADIGPVVVACTETEIKDVVEAAGGRAVLTDPDHPSGSDRIFEALQKVDPNAEFDAIVNLQGDLPVLEAAVVHAVIKPLDDDGVDIATLVAEISDEDEKTNPNVVKAVVGFEDGQDVGRALYFSRATVPHGDGPLWHHIGIYAYRRKSLERFVSLSPGVLEQRERLEQLRALENGMRIDAARVDTVPFGVDTHADLERARKILRA